ncbi:hypothetical protein PI124_g10555 [Phytophthora idaei]|nr:hypothetical protein PI124_g10555 [Phytophthora idaei]
MAVRNARIDSQGSTASKFPAEWDGYAKTYASWQVPIASHKKTPSPGVSGLRMFCPDSIGLSQTINVCVQEINKGNHTFALIITKCRTEHNHTLNMYAFKSHSSNRVSFDESVLQTVDELRKAGTK